MYLSDSKSWLINLLWVLLLVGSLTVILFLAMVTVRERTRSRWIAVMLAAVVVGATMTTAGLWIDAAKVRGLSCTMDALSTSLASGIDTADDRACLDSSRRRVGVSGGVELVVLAGSILWMRRRSGRRGVEASHL